MTAGPDRQSLSAQIILAAFPTSWRVDGRAAEALSIAWDAANDDDRDALGARENIDLCWLGLRARVTAGSLTLPPRTRHLIGGLAFSGGVALATFLLFIAAWPPPQTAAHPLASSGTILYVVWIGTGLLVASGREAAARCSLAGSAALTVAAAIVDYSFEIRGPALSFSRRCSF